MPLSYNRFQLLSLLLSECTIQLTWLYCGGKLISATDDKSHQYSHLSAIYILTHIKKCKYIVSIMPLNEGFVILVLVKQLIANLMYNIVHQLPQHNQKLVSCTRALPTLANSLSYIYMYR